MLGIQKRPQWIAPWIALVVGVHALPLAFVVRDAGPFVLAALVMAAAVAGFAARRTTPGAVTGAVAGAALLVFAGRWCSSGNR